MNLHSDMRSGETGSTASSARRSRAGTAEAKGKGDGEAPTGATTTRRSGRFTARKGMNKLG
eukprot:3048908-Pleurochrysis_carterae.AAC.1